MVMWPTTTVIKASMSDFDAFDVEEAIEAPVIAIPPSEAVITAPMSDFDEYCARPLDPDELVAEPEDGNLISIAELDAIEAEYQEFLVMEEAKAVPLSLLPHVKPVDEPEMVMQPAAVIIKSSMSDFDDFCARALDIEEAIEAPVIVIPPAEVLSQADILDIERCKAHNEATDWAEYKTWWESTGNDIDEPFEKVRARAELASVGIDMSNYNSVAEWARYELTDAVIMKIMPSAMDKWSRQYMWPAERKAYVECRCGPALAFFAKVDSAR